MHGLKLEKSDVGKRTFWIISAGAGAILGSVGSKFVGANFTVLYCES